MKRLTENAKFIKPELNTSAQNEDTKILTHLFKID